MPDNSRATVSPSSAIPAHAEPGKIDETRSVYYTGSGGREFYKVGGRVNNLSHILW